MAYITFGKTPKLPPRVVESPSSLVAQTLGDWALVSTASVNADARDLDFSQYSLCEVSVEQTIGIWTLVRTA